MTAYYKTRTIYRARDLQILQSVITMIEFLQYSIQNSHVKGKRAGVCIHQGRCNL